MQIPSFRVLQLPHQKNRISLPCRAAESLNKIRLSEEHPVPTLEQSEYSVNITSRSFLLEQTKYFFQFTRLWSARQPGDAAWYCRQNPLEALRKHRKRLRQLWRPRFTLCLWPGVPLRFLFRVGETCSGGRPLGARCLQLEPDPAPERGKAALRPRGKARCPPSSPRSLLAVTLGTGNPTFQPPMSALMRDVLYHLLWTNLSQLSSGSERL